MTNPSEPHATQIGGDHYQTEIQPIEFIQANQLAYAEGNVIKYVTRHRTKGGRRDIEKAIHYLQFILAYDYPDEDERFVPVQDGTCGDKGFDRCRR